MKKVLILTTSLISLSIVTLTMARPVASISYKDEAAAARAKEEYRQKILTLNANFEKGKTDDVALKEAINSLFEILEFSPIINPHIYIVEDMTRMGIHRKRQIQGLENIIRKTLFDFENDIKTDSPYLIYDCLIMLRTFPEYDMLPILKECVKSKNEIIHNDAQRYYNMIMEMKQNQPTTYEKSSQSTIINKTFLVIVISIILAIIGGVLAWRKKK